MKRNRIVINLDEKQSGRGARGRSGGGRPLLIIAIILLIVIGGLAAGGYFWWRHYQSSPAYSLALLVDAAQRNDGATVDGILDTGKISDDLVAQVRQKLPSSPVDSSLWPAPLDSIKTAASAKLKQTVHDQLMKEVQQLTDAAAGKPFIIVALAVPRFVDINEQDKVAHATANIKDQQIQLTMESDGQRWRIVAIKDDKLARMVADSLVHSVPANGSQVQDSIRKQLEGLK
jgi:hypothetical protein